MKDYYIFSKRDNYAKNIYKGVRDLFEANKIVVKADDRERTIEIGEARYHFESGFARMDMVGHENDIHIARSGGETFEWILSKHNAAVTNHGV